MSVTQTFPMYRMSKGPGPFEFIPYRWLQNYDHTHSNCWVTHVWKWQLHQNNIKGNHATCIAMYCIIWCQRKRILRVWGIWWMSVTDTSPMRRMSKGPGPFQFLPYAAYSNKLFQHNHCDGLATLYISKSVMPCMLYISSGRRGRIK